MAGSDTNKVLASLEAGGNVWTVSLIGEPSGNYIAASPLAWGGHFNDSTDDDEIEEEAL